MALWEEEVDPRHQPAADSAVSLEGDVDDGNRGGRMRMKKDVAPASDNLDRFLRESSHRQISRALEKMHLGW